MVYIEVQKQINQKEQNNQLINKTFFQMMFLLQQQKLSVQLSLNLIIYLITQQSIYTKTNLTLQTTKMSSSTIYNLKRTYDSNPNNTNYYKNKQQNKIQYQHDYILQNNQFKQTPYLNKSTSNKQQTSYLNNSSLNKIKVANKQNQFHINQSPSIKNNITHQQNPLEINRYLKQYQYNCYKLSDKKNQSFNSLKYQNNKILPLNNKNILNQQNQNKSHNLKQNSFHSQLSQHSHSKNKFSLNQSKINRSYQQIIPSKKLIFDQQQNEPNRINNQSLIQNDNFLNLSNSQKLCSKDEIALIKGLRSQIDDLVAEINSRDKYIKKLQQKLECYLVERIQVQKFMQQNTKILQTNVYQSQKQQQRILQQYKQVEYQLKIYEDFIKKLNEYFISDQRCKNVTDYKLIDELEVSRQKIVQRLQQLNRYKKLIIKMQQMKIKIQINKDKKQNNQLFNYQSNQQTQNINLYNLWKWIKKIGKQYQIMKCKVNSFKDNINR